MKTIGIISITVTIILVGAILVPACLNENPGKTLDVLIIDGQSNAEYGDLYVCDPEELNAEYGAVPNHTLYYFGTNEAPANQWQWSVDYYTSWAAYHIREMFDKEQMQWKIGGYEPILGNSLAERGGNDVLVVNMGIGARTIAQLLPDGADGDYSWGVLDRALAELSGSYANIRMAGVVWIQGESDHDTPVEQYVSEFGKLKDAFEGYGADKIYIVHTRDSFGGNANIAQEIIAESDPDVMMATYITDTFTTTNGMLATNADIHYSQKGRCAIAFDIEDKIAVPEPEPIPGSNLLMVIPIVVIVALLMCLVPIGRRD